MAESSPLESKMCGCLLHHGRREAVLLRSLLALHLCQVERQGLLGLHPHEERRRI